MTHITNHKIVLASRPHGKPTTENFRLEDHPCPKPKNGEVLLKVLYLSLDPYMRGRMNEGKSYASPIAINDVMVGATVAEIVESRHQDFSQGQIVLSYSGWQEYDVSDGRALRILDPKKAPITTALGVLGMPGFTAYSGLLTIGQPKEGETVVVAAATGPVGSAVGQIAKIKGARAIGIAGGEEKCKLLLDRFGFDAAIDRRSSDFEKRLKEALPHGIDVYFENVGGEVWNAVQPLLNNFARIPVCGLVAHYNDVAQPQALDRLPKLMSDILVKRLTVRGFIKSDFSDQEPMFEKDMSEWIREGRVKYLEDIAAGLENAPKALIGMLQGKNIGKQIIRVARDL